MTSYFIQKTKLRLPKVDLAIARKLPKLRRYRNVFSRKKEPFLSEKSLFEKKNFVNYQQDVNCSKPNTAIEDPLDVLNLNMFKHVWTCSQPILPSFILDKIWYFWRFLPFLPIFFVFFLSLILLPIYMIYRTKVTRIFYQV